MAKKLKNSKIFKEVRNDLMVQLELNGIAGKQYDSLVDDYMQFWITKTLLQNDINERGISVAYQNGKDQWGIKKNDSISELVKVNAQMLKILSELNLKPSKESGKNEPRTTEEDYY